MAGRLAEITINWKRANEKQLYWCAHQTPWWAWSWDVASCQAKRLVSIMSWVCRHVVWEVWGLNFDFGDDLENSNCNCKSDRLWKRGGATRQCPWKWTYCLCSVIVALLWVEVKWMQMWRQRGRPAVYFHAVCLTLLYVCLDILCPAFGKMFRRSWMMSDSLCLPQLHRCESIFSVLPHCGTYLMLLLITEETFDCCWDTLPIRTFWKKKKNGVRVARISRLDQKINGYFKPMSTVSSK